MSNYRTTLIIALVTALLAAAPAHSQSSADEILKQAQERASTIEEYRQLLNNPDQNVRVAGLDVMLKSDDPAMREIAFSIAFASADDTMRAIALKNKFNYLKTLNFKLILPEQPTELEKTGIVDTFSKAFTIQLDSYDANTGELIFRSGNGQGQVAGIGMDFNDKYFRCNASLTLGDGPELVGMLNCSHPKYKGNYKISLRLQ